MFHLNRLPLAAVSLLPVLSLSIGCSYEFSCHELRRCPRDAGRPDVSVSEPEPPQHESGIPPAIPEAGLEGEAGPPEREGGASLDAAPDAAGPSDGLVLRDMVRVGYLDELSSASRGPSISGDGALVAYSSRFSGAAEDPFFRVWLWARGAAPRRVDQRQVGIPRGDGDSTTPQLSADGTAVVFRSAAGGIVLSDTNGMTDAFWYDASTGITHRLSQSPEGLGANGAVFDVSISPDGQYAAFSSAATNLTTADANGQPDVFVYARSGGVVSSPTATVSADGPSASPRSGPDAAVVFRSAARNLIAGAPDADDFDDVFVSRAGTLAKVSASVSGGPASGHSREPALGGSFVAFTSDADNLLEGDANGVSDVFVHDLLTTKTERVSLGDTGHEADGSSDSPSISADGRFIAFRSSAKNLINGDTAGVDDVFVRDRLLSRTLRVSAALDGTEADGPSGAPALSADGHFVAFESQATNLAGAGPASAPGLTPGVVRVFRARVR